MSSAGRFGEGVRVGRAGVAKQLTAGAGPIAMCNVFARRFPRCKRRLSSNPLVTVMNPRLSLLSCAALMATLAGCDVMYTFDRIPVTATFTPSACRVTLWHKEYLGPPARVRPFVPGEKPAERPWEVINCRAIHAVGDSIAVSVIISRGIASTSPATPHPMDESAAPTSVGMIIDYGEPSITAIGPRSGTAVLAIQSGVLVGSAHMMGRRRCCT